MSGLSTENRVLITARLGRDAADYAELLGGVSIDTLGLLLNAVRANAPPLDYRVEQLASGLDSKRRSYARAGDPWLFQQCAETLRAQAKRIAELERQLGEASE